MSSHKQNREGVVGAQSGQYRATVVERAREVVAPGPGCDIKRLIFKNGIESTGKVDNISHLSQYGKFL